MIRVMRRLSSSDAMGAVTRSNAHYSVQKMLLEIMNFYSALVIAPESADNNDNSDANAQVMSK